MLYVDRTSVARPKIYDSPELESEFERLRDFHQHREERGQKQARSPLARRIPLLDPLLEGTTRLFRGKCAYCEQPVETGTLVTKGGKGGGGLASKLDFFRPHSEAIGLEGGSDPDHYWWLAFAWENHYLACADCLRYKRSQFPVVGNRLDYNPRARTYKRDKSLLLDPCDDLPFRWLEFAWDGRVKGVQPANASTRRAWADFDRGDATIQILGLNRSALVQVRKGVASRLEEMWGVMSDAGNAEVSKAIEHQIAAEAPHAGMVRQLLADRLLELPEDVAGQMSLQPLLRAVQAEMEALRSRTRTKRTRERSLPPAVQPDDRAGAVEEEAGAPPPATTLGTVRLERVWLKNYKAIHDLELSFNESGDLHVLEFTSEGPTERIESRASWKMLLGENGTGKSTVLEAIASVLMGPRLLDPAVQEKLDIAPGGVLRRGSRSGFVRVKFDGDETVWELRFTKTRYTFPNGAPTLATFVRGYGATRLLPGRAHRSEDPTYGESVDVANLFNPFVPLIDADAWLMGLSEDHFIGAARAITDLLNRAEDHYDVDGNLIPRTEELVTRQDGHVLVEGDPLRYLSDGYRTVLAMCCDIMAAVPHMADMHAATGIVLVDEIGAHLHPSWKMRIVPALRRTFPAVQFLATTHEPLALRGLLDEETTLMRRDAPGAGDGQRRVSVREDLPSPSELRVDQLLTSSLFGMDTTIDPDLDKKFSQLYYLLGRRDRTPEQDTLCERLRADLAGFGVLGYTRRDQKIYEIIDQLIAEERLLDPGRRKADRERLERLNRRTRERVLALWRYADLAREVAP